MVDSIDTNSFMHSLVIHKLNSTTVDVQPIRVNLANGSYIDYSIAISLYLKLCGNLYKSFSGVSQMVYVGCVLCCVLPTLTSDVVLGMD